MKQRSLILSQILMGCSVTPPANKDELQFVHASFCSGTTGYTYRGAGTNGAGLVATVDGPLGNDALELDYDSLGRVVSRTLGGVTRGMVYDALGRVVTVTNPLDTFTVAYNGTNGRLQSVSGTNGLAVTNAFYGATNDYRVSGTTWTWDGTNTLAQFGYQYDVLGRIRRWDHQVGEGEGRGGGDNPDTPFEPPL